MTYTLSIYLYLHLYFQLDRENKIFGIIPRIKLDDKSTYLESNTKQYDQVNIKVCVYVEKFLCAFFCSFSMYN